MAEHTTLTDRYVDAAMRTVPEAQRADLAAELRASIEDSIDARAADGEPTDAAERAVLTELGDPDKLAAGYTDRLLHLIGPRYYLDWWRLLKLLLWIVLPCAAVGVALGETLSGATFGEVVGTVVVTLIQVTVNLGFWTTLVFAIVERTTSRSAGPAVEWSPDRLPEPRVRGAGFGDMIANLVFLAVVVGAVLWDRVIGFVPGSPRLSFLDPGLWPWWMTGLFVLIGIEAVLTIVVYLVGRWTTRLAVVNLLLNIAVAVPAIWLLTQGRLLNAAFFPTLVGDDGPQVAGILTVVFAFGIAAIALWDTIDAFRKARAGRGGALLGR